MKASVYKISLDILKSQSQYSLPMKKGETAREIHITLREGGTPYEIGEECFAIFNGRKPDGNPLENNCVIKENTIIYAITPQTTSASGLVDCEIKLYGAENGLICAPRFSIIVDERIVGDEEIESTSEYTALTERYIEVQIAIEDANAAKKIVEELPKFTLIGGDEETEEPETLQEYNLITLATEVSTVDALLSFDGIAILKGYEYNGGSTAVNAINTDDKFYVLKVPVQGGDVIRCNTVSYWYKTTAISAYKYIGYFDSNGTSLKIVNLVLEGHSTAPPTYLVLRENGSIASDGSAYALINVFRDYYINDTTQYKNGLTASIVTLNQSADLTAFDGTAKLSDYIPVNDGDNEENEGETEVIEPYYEAEDDVRIPRYENALGDIESILASVVGGVE